MLDNHTRVHCGYGDFVRMRAVCQMGKASVNPISAYSPESNKVKLLIPAEGVSTCLNQGNDIRDWSRAPCVQEVV
jgi:hypothetical protein